MQLLTTWYPGKKLWGKHPQPLCFLGRTLLTIGWQTGWTRGKARGRLMTRGLLALTANQSMLLLPRALAPCSMLSAWVVWTDADLTLPWSEVCNQKTWTKERSCLQPVTETGLRPSLLWVPKSSCFSYMVSPKCRDRTIKECILSAKKKDLSFPNLQEILVLRPQI